MVCSMTGFGRGEAVEGSRRITVEMKSVNNRFLDLSMKMPRMLNPYEAKIRTEVGRFIRRGKVDLFISYVNAMTRICGRFWHRPSTRLAMRFLRRGRRRGNFCGAIFSASSMP